MRLVDSNSMRKLDEKAINEYGVKGVVLMENAGRGVAEIVEAELTRLQKRRVAIVCGKGNNGGDGFVSARHLKNAGFKVSLYLLTSRDALKGDALANSDIWEKSGGVINVVRSVAEFEKHMHQLRHSAVIVDAILGTGVKSDVSGIYATVIDFINQTRKTVVSVDVPSGLCATSGRVMGSAVKATVTATLGLAKTGLYLFPGAGCAGRVELVDIGMPACVADAADVSTLLIDGEMIEALFHRREPDTHKGSYGHVLVIGGSVGKTGAVCMAAMGALRAGAGLATAAVPESLSQIMEIKTTEVMTHPLAENQSGMLGVCSFDGTRDALVGKGALVIGPGLGRVKTSYIERTLTHCAANQIPVVMDADALNVIEPKISTLKGAAAKTGIVLTPHPGELARLFGKTTEEVQADRVGSALALAENTGCVVVLKGAATLVVSDGVTCINPTGNPGMATAGTGDVLAGMVGALLAQGLNTKDAAISAVYMHGLAGDRVASRIGQAGLVATDLLHEIPQVMDSFVTGNAKGQ